MTVMMAKPTLEAEREAAHAAATVAIGELFPDLPVTTIARTMTFLGLVQDGMLGLRRRGRAVTPTRYADIVDAAVAKAFDMSRCRG